MPSGGDSAFAHRALLVRRPSRKRDGDLRRRSRRRERSLEPLDGDLLALLSREGDPRGRLPRGSEGLGRFVTAATTVVAVGAAVASVVGKGSVTTTPRVSTLPAAAIKACKGRAPDVCKLSGSGI